MAKKHQGGLGRGFGEFFQTSATREEASAEETPKYPVTSQNGAARSPEEGSAEKAPGAAARSASGLPTSVTGARISTTSEAVPGAPDRSSRSVSVLDPPEPRSPRGESAPPDGEPAQRVTRDTELSDGSRLSLVQVSRIHPNPRQPRRSFDEGALLELSESIAEVGLLQPIVVHPDGANFELVMGERRWRAARLAGLDAIPAIIRGTDAKDLLRDALLENLHRAQLNALEEAAAYQQLLEDFGCTQDELSRRIKRSRSQIANTLRLMKLPRSIQRHLLEGTLTAGHARALLGANEPEEQIRIAEKIVDDGLSVRATEALVKAANDSRTAVKPHVRRKPGADEEATELATRLADVYDTEVRVKRSKGRGTIVLAFESDEDLERLVGILDRTDKAI